MTYRQHYNNLDYSIIPRSTSRPYQERLIGGVKRAIKDMIRHNRHKAIPGETITTPKLTSMLMESATGSGKTHTVFTTIEELRHIKNRHNSINEKGVFPNFNILVLTDRIGLGDQLRKKAVDGDVHEEDKTIELPILSDELIDHFHVKTYHSKVDYALGKYNNIHDVEVIEDGEKSIEAKEYMHFCTFQTAKNEIAREQIAIPNIIIIDEADIVTMGSDYLETLMSYYIPDEHGYYPLLLPITATPDNQTKEIFGEARVKFGLGEYLASGYGPTVDMYFETPPGISKEAIALLMTEIQHAQQIEDHIEKKEKVAEIKGAIRALLPERKDPEQSKAYLDRTILSMCQKITKGEKVMIFANTIPEADYITAEINKYFGEDIAIARHSDEKEDVSKTMENQKKGIKPIVVSVGQLVRGIDVPEVSKVFSLVDTESAKKYLQIFGRGMRGKHVSFYDYGGSLENMSYLYDIYTDYRSHKGKKSIDEQNDDEGDNESTSSQGGDQGEASSDKGGLNLYVGGALYNDSISHDIDIFELIGRYNQLEQSLDLTKENIKTYLDALGGFDTLMKYTGKDIASLDIKGNKVYSIAKAYGFQSQFGLSIKNPSGFQEFICFIYNKPFVYEQIEKEDTTKEDIISLFDSLGGFDTLMKYTGEDIRGLDIKGNKIMSIAKAYGFQSQFGLRMKNPAGFQEFICFVYGKEFVQQKEDITKEEIVTFFKGLGGFDTLMKYTKKRILSLEVKGNKIYSVAKAYGFQSQFGLSIGKTSGFQEFICFIYNKPFVYEQIEKEDTTKEDIISLFDSLGGFDTLMKYTGEDIRGLDIKGNKIYSIAKAYGFQSQFGLSIRHSAGFQEFICFVYGKEFVQQKEDITKEEIVTFFKGLGGFDTLMKYTKKGIQSLEIKGNKITTIATTYGFQSGYGLSVDKTGGFQEFICFVYGKEFVQQKEDITKEEIVTFFKGLGGFDTLMKYTAKDIRGIDIKGNKITTIATAYGFKSDTGLSIQSPSGFQEFICFLSIEENL